MACRPRDLSSGRTTLSFNILDQILLSESGGEGLPCPGNGRGRHATPVFNKKGSPRNGILKGGSPAPPQGGNHETCEAGCGDLDLHENKLCRNRAARLASLGPGILWFMLCFSKAVTTTLAEGVAKTWTQTIGGNSNAR